MGGDILGKAIVFLEEGRPGVYGTEEHGRAIEFATEAEVQEFEKRAGSRWPRSDWREPACVATSWAETMIHHVLWLIAVQLYTAI
ncbi:MAG: hypothetical protein ABI456_07545, partial [Ktedonobacteraceae bacterium]